ncbi:hybrid sensor histidine kinase/response regulator [Desulfolucanica intricata]|uniref:hybrid sensor histidine kinase/response regulator n=1 Tax=Desulfolucanica intricata TaxID=1285191 RepID=UPI00082EC6F1|nr:response regulator [Desulfolucanica intricata]
MAGAIFRDLNSSLTKHEDVQDGSTSGQLADKIKGKILIVDDMLMHLETAKLYLEMSGFDVFCASDTRSAWELLVDKNPDLVLLDVVMPGENGLEFLSKIHSHNPNMGVVIMTAFGSEDIAAMALKLGAMDYIRKPFKYSSLSTVVEKALAKQRQIKNQEMAVNTLKHAYEELQVSADSILQCMSAGVVAVDKNCFIRIINQRAAKLLGVENQNVIGRYYYEVFPFFKNNLLKNTLENERGVRLYEVELQRGEDIKILSVNTDVVFDFNSNKIGAVVTFDDVTELRQKEELLKERERLAIVGQMAAGMAHEIKNPLTAIKGFAQLLSGKSLDPDLNKYLDIIGSEINRMNDVIKDFLQLARPKPPELKKISINEVLKEITPIIEPQAFLKNIVVDIKTDEAVPESLMDPGQIKQVILNLLQNGMEAMNNGGTLTIETKYLSRRKEICLNISDTGCGIPAKKIKELGVPFYTTKPEGTGLGLSISFTIVDRHKGRIETKSREGQGTTFSVYLPVGK